MKRALLLGLAFIASSSVCLAKPDTVSEKEKAYMLDCAQAGMTEVKLANIAMKNAKAAAVKEFAQQMLQDHTKANNALKKVAEKKSVQLPEKLNAEKAGVVAKFEGLRGKQFDTAYTTQMVEDHKKVSQKLSEHLDVPDVDLKGWTKETLPTVKHHLEMAISMDKKIDK